MWSIDNKIENFEYNDEAALEQEIKDSNLFDENNPKEMTDYSSHPLILGMMV